MELGQLYSIPPLSIDLLDLCLEIEKWTAGQIDSFEISHFRDVRREFTDVLYYELYLFRGGEDLNYLDNLLPKVSCFTSLLSLLYSQSSRYDPGDRIANNSLLLCQSSESISLHYERF